MTSQRTVFRRVDGKWVNKLRGEEGGSTIADTRHAAVADAKRMLRNGGGGKLTVFDEDGQLAGEETIASERWIDMTGPSEAAELLLRFDGFIALVEEHDYDGVLWNTAGARWLEPLDPKDVPASSIREAQAQVDAAHAALLAGDPARAIDALERARQAIAVGHRDP
jgi:hypothetical protein